MHRPRRALARPSILALIAALAAGILPGGVARPAPASAYSDDPATVWINEIHYDNTGADTGEAIEVAGAADTDLAGWSIVPYNGAGGAVYGPQALSGTIPDLGGGYGVLSFAVSGLQNGAPDGIALANGTDLVQFLSYEGSFAGVGGVAAGVTSTDIGVSQSGSGAVGLSLQLTGAGTTYQDFTWQAESDDSFGGINAGQTFGADAAPTVTGSSPAEGAVNVATNAPITVTFSEPVTVDDGGVTIDCIDASFGATANPAIFEFTYLPPLPEGTQCTITIVGSKVHDADSQDPPDTLAADQTIRFTTASPDPCAGVDTPIGTIQGTGATAAVTGSVTVQGVVTGDYEGPGPTNLRGFYLQGAGDANAATSDGIFIFNNIGGTSPNLVELGQVVQVTGNAGENQEQTQVAAFAIAQCGTTDTVTPTDIDFPVASSTALERYEGMLVRVPEVMTVTEHFQLGRFGQVVISSDGRLDNPTAVVEPGAPALALQAQNNLRKVIVDDELLNQNPDPIRFGRDGQPLSASNTLRGGDTIEGLTGVLSYTWAGNAASGNAYRIRPINALGGAVEFEAANPRPGATVEIAGDTLRLAALNLLNYFNTFDGLPDTVNNCSNGTLGVATDCRGADTQAEFDRQVPKTVAAILGLDADVIGVNEIENDGYGPTSAIAHLVGALNAATAPGTYAFIDVDGETGQIDALGDDAIKVGLIYRVAAVTAVGTTAALNDPAFTLGGDKVPTDPNAPKLRSRPSLAQGFETADGARFVIDVNHFKSKGSACDLPDQGDGQGNCNVVRTNAATELAEWLATDPTGTGDADVFIMGDLNSYTMEDPIQVLVEAGFTNLVAEFVEDPYSYVFDGQWGYLDHALGSASALDQVAGVVEWHINSDEPSVLDYNTDFKTANLIATLYNADRFRVSDHDPIVVGLDAMSDRPTVDAGGPYEVEEQGSVQVSATGEDPTDDALTYAWDLDGNGSFESAGQTVAFQAGSLQAPQTVTVTVRVTDEHGQSSTDAADIRIIWDFGGFQAPSTPSGVTTVNAGASHPINFSLDGSQGLSVLDGNPTFQRVDCTTGAPVGPSIATNPSEPFSYTVATDTYTYAWKTQKAWAGSCGTLTLTLDDGESYDLAVRFKP